MDKLFKTPLQEFQYIDKYARFDDQLGRRETWQETVDRVMSFLHHLAGHGIDDATWDEIYNAIIRFEVMPSMRLMAMAGPAAMRNNAVIYNCSYLPIDSLSSWPEMLSICMGGTGVGYSVERQYVSQLPVVRKQTGFIRRDHLIEDSSEGWVHALKLGLDCWFNGDDMAFDYSEIRPQGAPLRTKGGRASGPEPLRKLLDYARDVILSRQGERITSLDCHDISTMLGDCVVQGGVRRSALIALFDADDEEMITCKDPDKIVGNYHRYNANNSAVWTREMSRKEIADQMYAMNNGGNGEPGIFSRVSAVVNRPVRRKGSTFGTNPCGEIVLRPRQFCNLTTAVARYDDTVEDLERKVRVAALIGTIQSSATYFPNLPEEWAENCKEERLLGVDINGQMDCPIFTGDKDHAEAVLMHLKLVATVANAEMAEMLGINKSSAITCTKPSGNSSTLLDCSPGLHPRHSPYYIRRVRVPRASSMYWVMYLQGMELKPENGQEDMENPTMYVASFPVKSPDGAIFKEDRGAIEQLDYWLMVSTEYTEHNPSCTITYHQDELEAIIDWLHRHQFEINGLSFLPASDMMYAQAPYEEISKEQYEQMIAEMPDIDFSMINIVDGGDDNTTVAQELACFAGNCEII